MNASYTIKVPEWLDRICVWPVMWYRKRKYGEAFRRIYLGEGEWTILDQEDYYRYGNLKWSVGGRDKKFYAIRGVKIRPDEIMITSMHREMMNAPKGVLVDHKNGNNLDNRRSNLRLATPTENSCNRRKARNGTSRYKGVCFHRRRRKWIGRIKIHGKSIFLGHFDREVEAARAYDEAAKIYHGEFARLNFTKED
ncbi:MAG: HNH endonuclease [Planctomycetota bacterium]